MFADLQASHRWIASRITCSSTVAGTPPVRFVAHERSPIKLPPTASPHGAPLEAISRGVPPFDVRIVGEGAIGRGHGGGAPRVSLSLSLSPVGHDGSSSAPFKNSCQILRFEQFTQTALGTGGVEQGERALGASVLSNNCWVCCASPLYTRVSMDVVWFWVTEWL